MKTPTPEEVKDRVAVRHGYPDWRTLSVTYFKDYYEEDALKRVESRKEYMSIETEAMQEYHKEKVGETMSRVAEISKSYHKGMLEQGSSELPTKEKAVEYIVNGLKWPLDGTSETNDMLRLFDWMKEQASVVIAKVQEIEELKTLVILKLQSKYDESIKQNDGLQFLIEEQKKQIENEKGAYEDLASTSLETMADLKKEIEELKSSIQKAYDEIWKTQTYPMETKGKPKGDDILKKHFPFIKP